MIGGLYFGEYSLTGSTPVGTSIGTRAGGDHGGGFAHVSAADPLNAGRYATGGDTWGLHVSEDGMSNSLKRMKGFSVTASGSVGPDLPIRALCFSKRPATSGRLYIGQGQIHASSNGNGFFGYADPSTSSSIHKGTSVDGFGTAMSGSAGQPRPAGHLIETEYDSGADIEYVYALTPLGLQRTLNSASQTPGDNRTVLALTTPTMWRWMYQWDANTMICVGWCQDFTGTAVNTTISIVTSSGAPLKTATSGQCSVSTLTSPSIPTRVNAIRNIGGNVYAACSDGVYLVTNSGTTWTKISGTFFSAEVFCIGGTGNTLYVSARTTGANPTHTIARSTAGASSTGGSWTWLIATGGTNVTNQLWGDGNPWWLYGVAASPDRVNANPHTGSGSPFVGSNIEVDPFDSTKITVWGSPGAWQSRDSGATWRPAMNGLNGAEKNRIRYDGSLGRYTTEDVDYVASQTTDKYATAIVNQTPGTFSGTAALTRTANGHTYQVVISNPVDLTIDGVSVADVIFQNMCVNPEDMQVDTDGTIYISQSGGGMVVVDPVVSTGGGSGPITTAPVTITVDYEVAPGDPGTQVFLPGPRPQGVEYTMAIYDHNGNQIADWVPIDLSFGRYRNQPGYVNADINLRHPFAKKQYINPDEHDWKLFRNDVPLLGGIVRGAQVDTDQSTLKVAGNEYHVYFDDVVMPFVPGGDQTGYNLHYVNHDMYDVVEGVVGYVMDAYAPDSLNITANNGNSGVITVQHLIAADLNTLTDIINNLAEQYEGFEYEVTHDLQLLLYTPRKGSRQPFMLDLASDEVTQVHYETGSIRGSTVYGRGQPAASSAQFIQKASNPLAASLYRHQDAVTDFSTVKNRAQLTSLTKGDLQDAISPLQSLIITYKPTTTDVWSQVDWGDSFRVMGDLYYEEIDDYYRIISIEGYCDDKNTEQVVFTMGEEII